MFAHEKPNAITVYAGTHNGRPRYVERNKKLGEVYERVIPAEIVFCQEIGAWVLRHDDIRTSNNVDNEVNQSFDLLFLLQSCLGNQVADDPLFLLIPEPVLVVDEVANNRFI